MSGTEAGLTWAAAMLSLLLSLVFFTSIKRFFSKTQPFSSFHANSNCNPISMPFDNSKAFLVSKDQVSQGFRPCSFTNKFKKQGRFYILGVRIKLDSLLNSTFSLSFWLGVGWQPKFARLVRSRHWILSPPRSVKGKPWILMIAFLRYLKYWVQTNRPRTNMISHVFRMVSLKGESPILGGIYCSISRGVRRFVWIPHMFWLHTFWELRSCDSLTIHLTVTKGGRSRSFMGIICCGKQCHNIR